MRRFAFIMLWLYVFTIPWEHSTDIGTGIGSVTRIVGIAALMAGLAAVAMCGSIRRLTLFHTTVSVLYLWILSSYLWTVDADATAMAIRTFAQAMWAVWLIWEFAPGASHRRSLMFAFVSGGYVTGYLTMRDYLGTTFITRGDVRFSPDGWNPNQLGILMALGVPMAALLICQLKSPLARAMAFSYMFLAPLIVVLTASRDGFVTLAIAAISVPVILGHRSVRRRLVAIAILAAGAATTVMYTPANSWNRLATIGSEFMSGNLNDRLPIWQSGIRTFTASSSNVVIGVGADGFLNAAGLGYVAHNTYLSVLVNLGLVGFTLFVLLLLQLIRATLQASDLERLTFTFCLGCWIVAVGAATWEALRPTWFLFGLIAASGLSEHPALVLLPTLPNRQWKNQLQPSQP